MYMDTLAEDTSLILAFITVGFSFARFCVDIVVINNSWVAKHD